LSRSQPGDALAAFTSALEADPTLARAVRGTAMAQMMQGKDREAKESFQRYLLLDPNADDALQIQKVIQSLDVEASR
jgi:Tfp pilus assembly protein PilF